MSKTLLQAFNGIIETLKGRSDEFEEHAHFNPDELFLYEEDTKLIGEVLGITPIQAILMAVILEKSSGRRVMLNDVSRYLGMGYLKLLSYADEVEGLRKKWLIRMDNDNCITVPADVLKALTQNKPYQKPQTKGLSTSMIMSRIGDYLEMVVDDEIEDGLAWMEIQQLIIDNPESSFCRTLHKYLKNVEDAGEHYLFIALMVRIFFKKREEFEMDDFERFYCEKPQFHLLCDYFNMDELELQHEGVIERVSEDGMLSKEKFKVKDKIVNEAFADVKNWSMVKESTVKLRDCSQMVEKQLFYNSTEQGQVERLMRLMEPEQLKEVFDKMKKQGLRTGFTCLFYGSPGTGKTETVYQLARMTGRKILEADVAQLKNCWVGETEKNARNLFREYRSACEENELTPILLFNEADAIFGVRMEGAQRAVDKMENSVQNIILQEMENFSGILIATTNLTKNLDKAFERRFLYKIRFEKPCLEARSKIWKGMIPEIQEEEAEQLAKNFDFSGGQIENVVRKRAVDSILNGYEPDFDTLMGYCKEEILSDNKTVRKPIGFV